MCSLCGKSFSRISTLAKHKQSVHMKTVFYPCGRCGKHFYRKDSWRRHQIQHQTARNWACPYCYSRFKTKQNCIKHIKTHQANMNEYQPSGTVHWLFYFENCACFSLFVKSTRTKFKVFFKRRIGARFLQSWRLFRYESDRSDDGASPKCSRRRDEPGIKNDLTRKGCLLQRTTF